jgi:hypothetical protein
VAQPIKIFLEYVRDKGVGGPLWLPPINREGESWPYPLPSLYRERGRAREHHPKPRPPTPLSLSLLIRDRLAKPYQNSNITPPHRRFA